MKTDTAQLLGTLLGYSIAFGILYFIFTKVLV